MHEIEMALELIVNLLVGQEKWMARGMFSVAVGCIRGYFSGKRDREQAGIISFLNDGLVIDWDAGKGCAIAPVQPVYNF